MNSDLKRIIDSIINFNSWPTSKKIKFFFWYKEFSTSRDSFTPSEINKCFEEVRIPKPSNTNSFIASLVSKKPSELIRRKKGFYQLSGTEFDSFNDKYGKKASTIEVIKLLKDLESKIKKVENKTFYNEAIRCFSVEAYRATIIMIWNMSYYHITSYIFDYRIDDFNKQLTSTFPKSRVKKISNFDDFSSLKESEVIQVAKSASIITNDVFKILNQKLGRRNSAAHPSTISISRLQAEEFIHDLISNVVLKYF